MEEKAVMLQGSGPAACTADVEERIRAILRLIEPKKPAGHDKIRLGRPFDGGYVLLDDFIGVNAAVSLGIDDDASWDLDIAQRGIPVHQYDHTIDDGPAKSPLLHFNKKRAGVEKAPGVTTLDDIIQERCDADETPVILKMDIEGDEWGVLNAAAPDSLRRCAQLICEFHHLRQLTELPFRHRAETCFAKLSHVFFVSHVHANNFGELVHIGHLTFPDTLEITFASRDLYEPETTAEMFPTALDQPNANDRADFFLGAFRF